VPSQGYSFVHLPKIGFDYRVRKDSVAMRTRPHLAEVASYVFGKREMACYKLLRETDEEVQNLTAQIRGMQGSHGYRLGRGLLAPARLLRDLWRCLR